MGLLQRVSGAVGVAVHGAVETGKAVADLQTWALAATPVVLDALPALLEDVVAGVAESGRLVAGATRDLAEAASSAKAAAASAEQLVARAERVVTALEVPLTALAPGLVRVAEVLDDPVVGELPDLVEQVQRDVLPVLRTIADTNARVATIAGSTERLMGFVDDTSRTLAGLPGAALLGRRRPFVAGRTVDAQVEPPARPADRDLLRDAPPGS